MTEDEITQPLHSPARSDDFYLPTQASSTPSTIASTASTTKSGSQLLGVAGEIPQEAFLPVESSVDAVTPTRDFPVEIRIVSVDTSDKTMLTRSSSNKENDAPPLPLLLPSRRSERQRIRRSIEEEEFVPAEQERDDAQDVVQEDVEEEKEEESEEEEQAGPLVMAPSNPSLAARIQQLLQNVPAAPQVSPNLAAATPTIANQDERQWMEQWTRTTLQESNLLGPNVDLSAIEGVTSTNKKYNKSKARSFQRFVDSMSMHPHFRVLAEETTGFAGRTSIKLFDFLRGEVTEEKMLLMNAIMLNFSISLKKTLKPGETDHGDPIVNSGCNPQDAAKQLYQPSAVRTILKHVFSVLRSNHVLMQQCHFKNLPGSYHLYWKLLFNVGAQYRSDFGNRPNRAKVDINGELKIRQAIADGKIDPNDYWDLTRLVCFYVAYQFARRGSLEVRITKLYACCVETFLTTDIFLFKITTIKWSDLIHGTEDNASSIFYNKNYFQLKSNNADKTCALSTTNVYLRENDAEIQRVYDNPKDMYCLYKLLKMLRKHFPPEWTSYLLLRRAPEKALAYQVKMGRTPFQAGVYRLERGSQYNVNQESPVGKFGANYANVVIKGIGTTCDFEVDITARSGRRLCGTVVGGANVSSAHQSLKMRHAEKEGGTQTHLYQENNKESADRLIKHLECDTDILKKTGQYIDEAPAAPVPAPSGDTSLATAQSSAVPAPPFAAASSNDNVFVPSCVPHAPSAPPFAAPMVAPPQQMVPMAPPSQPMQYYQQPMPYCQQQPQFVPIQQQQFVPVQQPMYQQQPQFAHVQQPMYQQPAYMMAPQPVQYMQPHYQQPMQFAPVQTNPYGQMIQQQQIAPPQMQQQQPTQQQSMQQQPMLQQIGAPQVHPQSAQGPH